LENVSAVLLDEFHERHLDTDLALALLRRLQLTSRPDLKLIVMSATLNSESISQYLGGCPIVRSEGRLFDVSISYTPHSALPLEQQVARALESADSEGDVLVFLPGSAEIRRAMRECEGLARSRNMLVVPLYGDLSPEEQDRAVQPADRRKIILSTNVAESSITIEGVRTVIDSGLARIASDSPWTGLPNINVQRISKASAIQRAGRAGRTRPGRAIRLYPLEDFQRRPDHDAPEIRRRELSQMQLELHALGITEVPWFEAPPAESVKAAEDLLDRLRADMDAAELVRMPLHPRLARLVLDGVRRRAGPEAIRLAALVSSGERIQHFDVLDAVDAEPSWRTRRIEQQLRNIIRSGPGGSEEGLRLAVLAAFPDRVVRRGEDLLVAVDTEERRESATPIVRLASAVTPEALVDLFPDRIEEREELVWDRDRVEARGLVVYDSVVIDETRRLPDPHAAAQLLAERALDAGLQRFADMEQVMELRARSEFAAQHSDLTALTDDDVRQGLVELCAGLRSFAELEAVARAGLLPLLKQRAGGDRLLNEVAPERLPLKNRQVKVHYSHGRQPWIASRLQDFFGLRETPRIGRGQIPVLAHLLAPNQRPVQMTTDLAGFWERLYPQIRRELSRRYPRHQWPENPNAS
jgi:ATP-dependent helicase HrpB